MVAVRVLLRQTRPSIPRNVEAIRRAPIDTRAFFQDEGHQKTSIVLGRWNHEQHVEWTKTNPKKRFTGNRKERQYVSLHYAAGDICPLTNTPRMVEVKLR